MPQSTYASFLRKLASTAFALLVLTLSLSAPAQADVKTLGDDVTIEFPATPTPVANEITGFSYRQPGNNVESLAGKLDAPYWIKFIQRRAPDALADVVDEKMHAQLAQQQP